MTQLQTLFTSLSTHLTGLTWLDGLDLFLVTVAIYLLLYWVRHSRAAFLLRGEVLIVLLLVIITLLLPLPTFDWLIQWALLAILFATPLIFQPELRHLLERIGRNVGLTRTVRQTAVEDVLSQLTRAVEHLSAGRTGALIALEGNASLQPVAETGVPIDGQVTAELLQAIFYPENPLHDGAVILHEDRLVAAGCVLPVTSRPLYTSRRLGTRHRAAVGLSETGDALVVVVSEETGTISVARDGQLYRRLDNVSLREHLLAFYVPGSPAPSGLPLWNLIRQLGRALGRLQFRFTPTQLLVNSWLFLISLLLAFIAWSSVVGG